MGIGKNSWKAAKEKAKQAGKKIRDARQQHFMSKSFSRIPAKGVNELKPAGIVESPVNGNAFGLAMQKADGDYKAAKAMLDASPANYGEIDAEDFKILQARRDSAANYKNYGVGSPANIKRMCGK